LSNNAVVPYEHLPAAVVERSEQTGVTIPAVVSNWKQKATVAGVAYGAGVASGYALAASHILGSGSSANLPPTEAPTTLKPYTDGGWNGYPPKFGNKWNTNSDVY
jgi:hypothetical protein